MSTETKFHSWPQMECVYLGHYKRCWKNVRFFESFQIATIFRLMLPSRHYPVLTEFKSDYAVLGVKNYFPPCNSYPTGETSLASHYYIAINLWNGSEYTLSYRRQCLQKYFLKLFPSSSILYYNFLNLHLCIIQSWKQNWKFSIMVANQYNSGNSFQANF